MSQVNAVIDLDINTGGAAAALRQLQGQLNAFQTSLNKNNMMQAAAAKEYAAGLSSMINQSKFFTAETVKMRTAASQLDDTLSRGRGTMAQFLGARFVKQGTAASQVMQLANARAAALQTQFVATGAAAGGFQEALAIRPMQAFNKQAAVTAERLAIQRAMLTQATTSMVNFGKNTQWAGRQLMVGFTVPLTLFGAVAGKTFMDLEKQAVAFKKVYGDAFTTPAEMDKAFQDVKRMANEFTKYGIAAADTMALAAEAAAAGAKGANLTAATTQATRLATLGQMEQSEALKATISLQNAFNISSKELGGTIDFLNQVENQTVVTLQDLAAAIPRVAPVIKGLGGDVQDMAAMLAAMQEGGVTAAQGANALKSGLASLINPTDRAVGSLKALGINMNSIINANRGDLMGTVMAFGEALDTLDEFGKQQALEKVFGKYQYARLGALFNNIIKDGTQASRVMDIAAMSAGQLAASSERELGRVEQSTTAKFTAAMEKLKLSIAPIGEMFLKIATPIVGLFTKVFEWLNKLPDGAKNFLAISTAIVGVVVPAGTMFLGLLLNLMGTLVKFGHIIGVTFKGFLTGGFSGALKAVSQSLHYMSLAEIDTANAATQLGGSAEYVNAALREQVGAAGAAQAAIIELGSSYVMLADRMMQASAANAGTFGVAGSAMGRAGKAPIKVTRIRRAYGGTIPGVGNQDTVPAMLTPGEFVINKQATQQHLPLLHAINNGDVQGLNTGGPVQYLARGAAVKPVPLSAMQASATLRKQTQLDRIKQSVTPDVPSLYDILYPGGVMNPHAKVQKRHPIWMGLPPETLKAMRIEQLGALTALLPTSMNQKFRAGGMMGSDVRAMIKKISLTPDQIYSPVTAQMSGFMAADPKRKLALNSRAALKNLLDSIDDGTLYKDANFTSLFRKSLSDSLQGTAGDSRAFISAATAPKSFKIKGGFQEGQSTIDWAKSIPLPPGYKLEIEYARTKANPEGKHSKTRMYIKHPDGNRIDITPNSELGTVNSQDGIVDYTRLRGRLGAYPGYQYTHVRTGGQIMPGGGVSRLNKGGLFLGGIHGMSGRAAVAERLAKAHAASTSGRFATLPITELGKLKKGIGGFSSSIPGLNGIYEGGVFKAFESPESALMEARSAHVMNQMFGLHSPDQRVVRVKHPVTGQVITGVLSPYDPIFGNPTGQFGKSDIASQIIAGAVRRDRDGQPDNIFGSVVADNGPSIFGVNEAGIPRASEPRLFGQTTVSASEQLAINMLQSKAGGAKKFFAEQTAGVARTMSEAEYVKSLKQSIKAARARAGEAIAGLPMASAAEKEMYLRRVLADLDDLEQVDFKTLYRHHTGLYPDAPKTPTAAAIAKKAAAAAQKLRTSGHNVGMRYGIPGFNRGGLAGKNLRNLLANFELDDSTGTNLYRNKFGAGRGGISTFFGRMQPPTVGHGMMMEQAMIAALRDGSDMSIFTPLFGGKDARSPIPLDQRLASIFESKGIRANGAANAYTIFDALKGAGYTDVLRIIGATDAGSDSFGKAAKSRGMRSILEAIDRPEGGVSGTGVRAAAMQGSLEAMAKAGFLGGSPKTAEAIMRSIMQHRNAGGPIYQTGGTPIVPGVGSTDTVPAMLTPGEFVVNKQATRGNLGLLHALNNGSVPGFNQGGLVPMGMDAAQVNEIFKDRRGRIVYEDGTPVPKNMLPRTVKPSRASRMPRVSMGAGMGLGAVGGAMMMAPLIPAIGNNPGLSSAFGAGGMALSMASILPMLGAAAIPVGILAGAATAAGVGLYKFMEAQDDASRKAAEFGANLGGTANALRNVSNILGVATPSDRQAQMTLGLDDRALQESAQKFSSILETESFQGFVTELTAKTSPERMKMLTEYMQQAVAAGMMKKKDAQEFAKVVGLILKDPAVGAGVAQSIARQATGPNALLDIANQKAAAVSGGAGMKAVLSGNGLTEFGGAQASEAIGGAMQVIQQAANAEAYANEQFAAGQIGFAEYTSIVDKARELQNEYNGVIQTAMEKTNDFGSTMIATKEQLIKSGMIDDEQWNAMLDAADRAKNNVTDRAVELGIAPLGRESNWAGMTAAQVQAATSGKDFDPATQLDAVQLAMSTLEADLITALNQNPAGTTNYLDFAKNIGEAQGLQNAYAMYAGKEGMTSAGAIDAAQLRRQILMGQIGGVGTFDSYAGTNKNVSDYNANQRRTVAGAADSFVQQGGSAVEFQKFAMALPEEKRVKILATFEDKDQQVRQQWMTDYYALQQSLGSGLATRITMSAAYQSGDPLKRQEIFDAVAMFDRLPQNMDKNIVYDVLLTENGGKPVTVKQAGEAIGELKDAWDTLASSKDKDLVKKAQITIATYAEDADGNRVTADMAAGAWDAMIEKFGSKKVYNLPPDIARKVLGIYIEIDGIDESIANVQGYLDAVNAGGTGASIAAVEAASAQLAALKKLKKSRVQAAASEVRMAGTPPKSSGSDSGGGEKQKTIIQELTKSLKDAQSIYTAMQSILSKNKNGFKNFIAGPFAPQFIEFLKSQGDRGLKILKEHGAKFRKAYDLFQKQQIQLAVNVKQQMPAAWRTQAQESMGKARATAQLSKQGLGQQEIEQYIGALPQGTLAAYNKASMTVNNIAKKKKFGGKDFWSLNTKQQGKVMDKAGLDETERRALFMFKFSKDGVKAMQAATYEAGAASIKLQNDALANTAALQGMGIDPEIAAKLNDMGISASMSKKQINGLVSSLEKMAQLEWNSKTEFEKQDELINTQLSILDTKRQIAELTQIQPLQDEIDALGEQNSLLDRQVELKNRSMEAIDESIAKYEEEKNQINDAYDERLKALDEIEKANDRIYKIQSAQLSIANSLSRGDVAGAAGAMQQLQQDLAATRSQETRDGLENARASQLKAIDAKINELKAQRKVIENDIKNIQNQQRALSDMIYVKQQAISLKTREINETYKGQELRLASLNNQLAQMEQYWIRIQRLAANDNSATTLPGAAPTVPTYTPTGPNSGNYSGYDTSATNPLWLKAMQGVVIPGITKNNGGRIYRFDGGGMVPGEGMTDKVPALLTPGEWVMRKSVAETMYPVLNALNTNAFPTMGSGASVKAQGAGGNEIEYNYEINVNVAGTNASPDDIANAVLGKIKGAQDRNIRSYRY